MKKLLFTLLFIFGFSASVKAGWGDFMKTAVSKVGSAVKSAGGAVGNVAGKIAKTAGTAATNNMKCSMLRKQGMMNSPQYYQECIQTGIALRMGGMGGSPVGLPYGVMPPTGIPGAVQNSTLNQAWSDDPLAGVGAQMTQQQNMMGRQGMMGGGMMGQGQPTSFPGMMGQSLVNNFMGGNRGGYGLQSGYGPQPGYGARPY